MLCFGVLKEQLGGERVAVELADGACVRDFVAVMRGRTRGAGAVWSSVAVAVNREYAGLGTVLHEGDEVALLPPVSGGAA